MKGIFGGYWDTTFQKPIAFPVGESHVLLCLPTGGGKFSCYQAGMLGTFEGSVFCIDPKLQMAAVTARFRKEVLKQDVCVLNPFKVFSSTYLKHVRHAKFDPLNSNLDPKSFTFAADADNMMEGLMPHGGPDVHWVDTARQLGSGIGMHLRTDFKDASLPKLYQIMASRRLHEFCEDAVAGGDPDKTARVDRFVENAKDNRELRSVISTGTTKLGFLGNRPIAESMSESTVDFREMRKRPMTIYAGLPGRYIGKSEWLRTITNSFADAMLDEGRGGVPVLAILDEYAIAVGKLQSIDTLLGLGRGYGCQVVSVLRGLSDLKLAGYGEGWESWVGNHGYQIFGRPREPFTASYISRLIGTIDAAGVSKSFSQDKVNVSSNSRTVPYMRPEDIMSLPDNQALTFCDGIAGVIRSGRLPYFLDPAFAGKFDEDPFHAPKKS